MNELCVCHESQLYVYLLLLAVCHYYCVFSKVYVHSKKYCIYGTPLLGCNGTPY